MKIEPGMFVLWGGKLVQVIGVADSPTAILEFVRDEDRPRCICGHPTGERIHTVIGCRIWDDNIASVSTIERKDR